MHDEIKIFADEIRAEHGNEPESIPIPLMGDILLPSGLTEISECATVIFKRMAERDMAFYRGGKVHEVGQDSDGRLRLEIMVPEAFRSRIEKLGKTKAYVKNQLGQYNLTPKRPSYEDCKALLATIEARKYLQPVANVHGSPVLVLDDGIPRLLKKGYHPVNGGMIVCDGDHVEEVEPGEAAHALDNLLCDFRFVSDSDRTRCLSTILSPALRFGGFLRGNCPVHSNEADQSQTGKGYNLEMVAAIYAERPALVTMKAGGVGSFDESLAQRLVDGRPFIQMDNLRGKMDSQFLEAVLTAPGEVGCRIPHKGEVYVQPRTYFFSATSNGFESTDDLANRSCIIRLRKQSPGYRFKSWPEGDLIEHVRINQTYYLGCVHAIILDWLKAGAPQSETTDHDFRNWARTVEGIIFHSWPDAAPLMDGHRQAQARTTNPALAWLRAVCLAIETEERLACVFRATDFVEICLEHGIDIPGLTDLQDEDKAKKAVGMLLRRALSGDALTLDEYEISRHTEETERTDGRGTFTSKHYTIQKSASQQPATHSPAGPVTPLKLKESIMFSRSYRGVAGVGGDLLADQAESAADDLFPDS